MKKVVFVMLLILCVVDPIRSFSKDDFLTSEEENAIRDALDSGKRVVLYLAFAQRRITDAQEKTVKKDPSAGQAIQKDLDQFNSLMEALDDSLQNARKERSELNKTLKELENQATHFLKVLQQLANAPMRGDYQFTLDESVEMTKDELAEVKKGSFPEVNDRKPPVDLPASPPPSKSANAPPSKSGNTEEGPPRKKGRLPDSQ